MVHQERETEMKFYCFVFITFCFLGCDYIQQCDEDTSHTDANTDDAIDSETTEQCSDPFLCYDGSCLSPGVVLIFSNIDSAMFTLSGSLYVSTAQSNINFSDQLITHELSHGTHIFEIVYSCADDLWIVETSIDGESETEEALFGSCSETDFRFVLKASESLFINGICYI